MLPTQGFCCQIRIVMNFNITNKSCAKHKKVLTKWIIIDITFDFLYHIMELGCYKIDL